MLRPALRAICSSEARAWGVSVARALADEHAAWLSGLAASHVFASTRAGASLLGVIAGANARLYGWCLPPGGETVGAALLGEFAEFARSAPGVSRIVVGGPGEHYLVSGVRTNDDTARACFAKAGLACSSRHVDIEVGLDALSVPPVPPTIERASAPSPDALEWIEGTFSREWALEAARAQATDALFVARGSGGLAGFVAHSGVNAALGNFGPLGVAPAARGQGTGQALARAALGDLRRRGFVRARIPWVARERVVFYQRLSHGAECDVIEREIWARDLPEAPLVR